MPPLHVTFGPEIENKLGSPRDPAPPHPTPPNTALSDPVQMGELGRRRLRQPTAVGTGCAWRL